MCKAGEVRLLFSLSPADVYSIPRPITMKETFLRNCMLYSLDNKLIRRGQIFTPCQFSSTVKTSAIEETQKFA